MRIMNLKIEVSSSMEEGEQGMDTGPRARVDSSIVVEVEADARVG